MNDDLKSTVPDKLDPRVAAVTLFVCVIEFELFTFSRGLVDIAQQDAWISILLGGLIATLTTYLMVKLASRFPRQNYFQYNKVVWGKYVAFILAIGYFIYWAVFLTLLFQDTTFANKFLFLKQTPSIVPMLILAIAAAWLVLYGMTSVIRFFQISFPFIFIPLLVLFALTVRSVNIDNFFPVLSNGFLPVLKGAVYFAGALQGLEVILFLSPFLTDVKSSVRPAIAGVGLIWLVTVFQLVSAIGLLGVESIKHSVYPGYTAMTVLELPGFPVERFELFLTFPWIFGVFTTICVFIYLLSFGIMQVFNLQNRKAVVFTVTGLIVVATYIIPNFAVEEKLRQLFNLPALLFVYVIPIMTLLVAFIRSKKDDSHA